MRSLTLACLASAVTATKLEQVTLDHMEFDELAELQQSVNELTELFLESNSEKGPHTCTTTSDRNKKEVANFYQLVQGWLPYSDPDFTPDASSLDWADQGEKELAHFSSVEWVRA